MMKETVGRSASKGAVADQFNDAVRRTRKGIHGWDELRPLCGCLREVGYGPQDVVYHQGKTADSVFVIGQGLIKLIVHLPNGRARIVRLLARGDLVGMECLFGRHYDHSAVAIGDVRALRVPVTRLQQIRAEDPTLYCDFLTQWYQCVRDADLWITQFSTGSIRARTARLINFLSGLEYTPRSRHVELLTCEEMAAILGVTPESVSRVVAAFKREKFLTPIRRRPHELFERDTGALEAVAQG